MANEFAVVLAERGTDCMSIDINRGTQKPPQKNWIQSRVKDSHSEVTKGSGKAMREPTVIMRTARGKALWFSNPPNLVNAKPPNTTPATGPVIAHTAKLIEEVALVEPST